MKIVSSNFSRQNGTNTYRPPGHSRDPPPLNHENVSFFLNAVNCFFPPLISSQLRINKNRIIIFTSDFCLWIQTFTRQGQFTPSLRTVCQILTTWQKTDERMERSLKGREGYSAGVCPGGWFISGAPWSFPYIEMRPQSLNFPGALVRVGEVKPCSCCAPFTLLTKARVVTSPASA